MNGRAFPWLLLTLVALWPYLNAMECEFVYDDRGQIEENPYVSPEDPWWVSLTRPYWPPPQQAGLYRPVTSLTYRLQRGLHGNHPAGFHALNLFLHVGVVLAAYGVLRRLACSGDRIALAAGLIFAVHPLHTEAVTGIVGRAELLSALFGLLGYWIWLRARRAAGPLVGMLLCFALAAGAKESAAGWVLLMGAHRLGIFGDGRGYGALAPKERRHAYLIDALVLAGFVLYLLPRIWVLGSPVGLNEVSRVDNPIFAAPIDARLLTAVEVIARGLGLMIWPTRLSVDYSFNAIPVVTSWASLAGLGTLLLCGATYWAVRHGRRAAPLAWGFIFYGALLLPVSNLILPIGTIMAERLLYLPSLGVLFLVTHLLARGLTRLRMPRLAPLLLVLIVVLLGLRTWDRNRDWRNNRILFEAAAEVQPHSVRILNNLGCARVQDGEIEAGLAAYRRAQTIEPDYHAMLNGLGHALILHHDYREAEEVLLRSMRARPIDPEPRYRLGNLLLEVARAEEALGVFDALLAIRPVSSEGRIGKASAHFMLGDYAAAADAWESALALPGNPRDLARHLAVAQIRAGRPQAALQTLRALLPLIPEAADLHYEYARLLIEQNAATEAGGLAAAERAFQLRPTADYAETLMRHLIVRQRCAAAQALLATPAVRALDDSTRAVLGAMQQKSCEGSGAMQSEER